MSSGKVYRDGNFPEKYRLFMVSLQRFCREPVNFFAFAPNVLAFSFLQW